MLAMGATAIAFTPARTALIGEGPTEAVILPSLLREALGTSRGIGIQVAPGLAGVPDELAEELEADAGTVLYLVDDDEGGRTHAEKISQAAHDAGRVFVLGDGEEPGMSTEDLVERQLLCAAVNSVLALTRPEANVVLIQEEIPDVGRGAFIDEWCRSNDLPKLSKPHIAHEAIWKYLDAPDEWTLVEPDRMVLLKALGQNLLEKVPTAAH
jgi:predicted ATP-dependent endonuclease of OLD family